MADIESKQVTPAPAAAEGASTSTAAPGRTTLLSGGEPEGEAGAASPLGVSGRYAGSVFGQGAKRSARGASAGAGDDAPGNASGRRGGGAGLPDNVKGKFEASLGRDLSDVRVHTGEESANAASAVGARAYALGQDIHFGAGQYDPSNSAGQHLLAHEVAHTVQQQGGAPTRQNKLEVSSAQDPSEHEADRAADAMMAGAPASVTSVGQHIQRKEEAGAPGDAGAEGTPFELPISWSTPEFEFLDKEVGEWMKVKGAYKAGVSAKYKNAAAVAEGKKKAEAKKAGKEEPAGPEVSTGLTKSGDGPAGVKLEVNQELESGIHGVDFSVNYAEIKYNGKKFSLGTCPCVVETKWGPVKLEAKPIAFDVVKCEVGKPPEFAVMTTSLQGKIPVHDFKSKSGAVLEVSTSGEFEFEIMPNWVRIGEWIAEHMAETAIEGLAETAGMVGAIAAFTYASIEAFKEMEQLQMPIERMAIDACKASQKYGEFLTGRGVPESEAERRVAARANTELARVAATMGRTPDEVRKSLRSSGKKVKPLADTAMVGAKNECFTRAKNMVDQYWAHLSWFERTFNIKDKPWLYDNASSWVEKNFALLNMAPA